MQSTPISQGMHRSQRAPRSVAPALIAASSIVSLLACGVARAEDAMPAYERRVADMSTEEVERGLAFVEHSFSKQRTGASLWWSGWTAFNVFNIAVGIERCIKADTRLARDSWVVSIIGAGVFVAEVSILPLPGLYGYRRLSRIPSNTEEQMRAKLIVGLRLLDKAARVEAANSNLTAHLAALAYASISTGYVWIRNREAPTDRLKLAVGLQFGTSLVFGELTLWTVPRRARRDLRRFERAFFPKSKPEKEALSVAVGANHLQLRYRF